MRIPLIQHSQMRVVQLKLYIPLFLKRREELWSYLTNCKRQTRLNLFRSGLRRRLIWIKNHSILECGQEIEMGLLLASHGVKPGGVFTENQCILFLEGDRLTAPLERDILLFVKCERGKRVVFLLTQICFMKG